MRTELEHVMDEDDVTQAFLTTSQQQVLRVFDDTPPLITRPYGDTPYYVVQYPPAAFSDEPIEESTGMVVMRIFDSEHVETLLVERYMSTFQRATRFATSFGYTTPISMIEDPAMQGLLTLFTPAELSQLRLDLLTDYEWEYTLSSQKFLQLLYKHFLDLVGHDRFDEVPLEWLQASFDLPTFRASVFTL